jgi:hypothetical protein
LQGELFGDTGRPFARPDGLFDGPLCAVVVWESAVVGNARLGARDDAVKDRPREEQFHRPRSLRI